MGFDASVSGSDVGRFKLNLLPNVGCSKKDNIKRDHNDVDRSDLVQGR